MLIRLTYCARCGCYYPRDNSHFAASCDHPRRQQVAVTAERVGVYEIVHLRLGGTSGCANASGMLWHDGNGGTLVEYQRRFQSLDQWTAWVGDKSPVMLEAFRRRWEPGMVRRSYEVAG